MRKPWVTALLPPQLGRCEEIPTSWPSCCYHDLPSFSRLVDPPLSQKFGKLKKAFESDNSGAAAATAPSVATPPVAPSHAETKTTPAVAVRKRKATTTAEATKDLPKKKLKQVKKESEDEEQAGDGEDATEVVDGASDGDTPSPGEEGANKDQATRIKAEE